MTTTHKSDYENYDVAEQRQFDALASGWWDPQGPFKPLHDLNPARLTFVTERCSLRDATVLDVGCGGGILAEAMAKAGAQVTGIDVAGKVLAIARLHQHESAVEVDYHELTIEAWADAHPASADVVTCMEMIEHVPDPASVIRAIGTVLKPGGQCFLSTLNRTPAAFLLGIVGAEHIVRILPVGTHRYDRFVRPSELCDWLRRAALEVGEVCGIHYNPLSRTVKLGGSVTVNYLVHAFKSDAEQAHAREAAD